MNIAGSLDLVLLFIQFTYERITKGDDIDVGNAIHI